MENVSSLVARQYDAYAYPPPVADLNVATARGAHQLGDPSLYAPLLWPEGRPQSRLRILVAGCGTQQAAWFAFANRDCDVIGVDLSEASLSHERYLKERHALSNLTLYRGDLRDTGALGRDFDLVICTGVLHHLSDPDEGVAALADVMAPHGALVCMLYALVRRTGVYMLQDAFRRLGLTQDARDVALVRRILGMLPAGHYVKWYESGAKELAYDEALVDTFLHAQDRAYTVPELLAFVARGGLRFAGWFENSLYYPDATLPAESPLGQRIAALPSHEQWAVMEMLFPYMGGHDFVARKPGAPAISFEGEAWRTLVPHPAPGLRRLSPGRYQRGRTAFELTPAHAALLDAADGKRTIAALGGDRSFFERLWRQGHMIASLA